MIVAAAVVTKQLHISLAPPERVCASVANSTQVPLYVVVPRSRNRHLGVDCKCHILFLTNQECFSFESCYCAIDTAFAHSLRVCQTQNSTMQACFSGFTNSINNTLVHFYEVLPLSVCSFDRSELFRKYVKAFQIIILDGEKYLIASL